MDLSKKQTYSGADYLKVNPKGYVPALQLDNGEIFNRRIGDCAICWDQVPELQLIPPANTLARYHCQEWLSFISSEIHKTISVFFKSNVPDEYKKMTLETLAKRFQYLDDHLSQNKYSWVITLALQMRIYLRYYAGHFL